VAVAVAQDTLAPMLSLTAMGEALLTCTNTTVSLQANTGAAAATWQWQLDGVLLDPNPPLSWAAEQPGMYTLYLTNTANGCSTTRTLTVEAQIDQPSVTLAPPDLLTCQVDTVVLAETTAPAGLSYTWEVINGSAAQPQLTGPTLLVDTPGTYAIMATDGTTGCVGRDTVSVMADLDPPVITLAPVFALDCQAESVQLAPVAAQTDYAYVWAGNDFSSTANAPVVGEPGLYAVTVTDPGNGCTSEWQTEVVASEGITAVTLTVEVPTCLAEDSGSIAVVAVDGGTGPFLYALDGAAFTPENTLAGLSAGTYLVQVQDSQGCSWSETVSLPAPVVPTVALPEEVTISLGDSVRLLPIYTGTPAFLWEGEGLSCYDCPEPYAHPEESTAYRLTISTAEGCVASAQVRVVVDGRTPVFAPTVFSPNGDGANDYFNLYGSSQLADVELLQVFDRWGNLLYEGRSVPPGQPSAGWDGYFRGQAMPVGVYVFRAEVRLANGETRQVAGEVLLLR
ncbi:MAG: gliding motility-associated C-terminal domain-containing protein, partial [Lewinella sp.]|nr:gliding motility-associated C-terminal domain-containing protein [Lewinella sp.]